MKISITGKFGSGKSMFAEFLSENTINVINADLLAKKLLKENKEKIFSYLDIEIENDYLSILKRNIIKNEEIFKKYNNWMYEHLPSFILNQCDNYDNVILDAALVFEWGIEWYFDINILIINGNFEERFERIKKSRANINKNLYKLLEKYQFSDQAKKQLAQEIVYNNSTIKNLKKKANEIYKKYFNY